MSETQYENRQLTPKEAQILSQAIRETPNITYYSAKKLGGFKNVFVAEIDKELAGVGILDQINEDWWELKIVFVFESYREKGIGLSLTKIGIDFLEEKKVNIFAISRNPVTIKWLEDNDFEVVSGWKGIPGLIKKKIVKSSINPIKAYEYIRKSIKYGSMNDWQYFIKFVR